jgi:PKD repeat protein
MKKILFIMIAIFCTSISSKAVLVDTSKLTANIGPNSVCVSYLFDTNVSGCEYYDSLIVNNVSNDTIYVNAHTTPLPCFVFCLPNPVSHTTSFCKPVTLNPNINYRINITETAHDPCNGIFSIFRKVCFSTPLSTSCIASFLDTTTAGVTYFTNQSTTANGGTTTNNYWTFGDGTTSNQTNPFHTYANPGAYNVCLVITDSTSAGVCVDSVCQTIVVPGSTPTCNANFAYSINPNGVHVFTNTSNNTSASYVWDFGDGTTSTQNNPSHYYPNNGIYNVCLKLYTVTNVLCDSQCVNINVTNGNPCNLVATTTPTYNTSSNITVFASVNGGVSPYLFTYDFGDGTIMSNTNSSSTHQYSATGIYTYCVTVLDGNGCSFTSCGSVTIQTVQTCIAAFTASQNSLLGTVNFTNNSVLSTNSIYSYWQFGDGTIGYSSGNINHTYTASGTYTACLYLVDSLAAGACDSFCDTIIVNTSMLTPCNAAMTYTSNGCHGIFVNTSATGYTNALWVWGDGTSSVNMNQTVTHTYPATGVYYPQLIVYYGSPNTPNYCVDTSNIGQLYANCSTTTTCNAAFVANQTTVSGLITFTNNSTYNSSSAISYWSFGDGTTGFSNGNTIHIYNSIGTYNVCLYIMDSINQTICDSVCNTVAVLYVQPTTCNATMTYTSNGCQGIFVNTSTTGFSNAVWYFGDGTSASNINSTVLHTYPATGVYFPYVVVSYPGLNGAICIDTSSLGQLYINCGTTTNCNAVFTTTNFANGNVTFTNSSTYSVITGLSLWNFGDGTTAYSNGNINHTYTANGTYQVCLYVLDSFTNVICDSVCNNVVITNINPITCNASMTYSSNGCQGIFVNTSPSGYSNAQWIWGDGTSTVNNNSTVVHTYPNSGVYASYLIVSYNNIIGPQILPINYCSAANNQGQHISYLQFGAINHYPSTFTATPYGAYYPPTPTTTTSVVAGNTYPLTFTINGVNTNAIAGVWIDYNRDGVFGTTEFTQLGLTNAPNIANTYNINIPSTAISGLTRMRVRTRASGNLLNASSSCITMGSGGWYDYDLNILGTNNLTCVDTVIGQLPITCSTAVACNAFFTASQNSLSGMINFTNNSVLSNNSIASYWDFGDGTTGTSNGNINHTYSNSGTYFVCLYLIDSITNAICDTFCNTIVVNNSAPAPCNAVMTYSSNMCQGIFVNTSASGYTNALWVWGDGSSTVNNNSTVVHTYPSSGVYYPYLVISYANPAGGVCTDTSALGQLPINCSTSVCNASFVSGNAPIGVVSFSNTSSNSAFYLWTFGDGTTSNSVNPIHTYTVNGVYNVCLYLYNNNQIVCDSQCSLVAVTNLPFTNNCNATITSYYDTSSCQGILDVYATGIVTNILWQFGDGTSTNGNTLMATHNYLNNGVYTANAIVTMVDSNGTTCIDSSNYIVIYAFCPSAPACNASFTFNNNPAGGINFNNTSTAAGTATYLWYFGDGNSSSLANPLHTYSVSGSYNVCLVLYDQANNCVDSFCNMVTYTAPQSCAANYSYSASGNTISFTNTSTANSIFTSAWYFGNGITSTQTNPTYSYPVPGTYNVCLVIINNNCIDSTCQTIVVGNNVCNANFTASVNGCNATLTNTSTGPYNGGVWLHSDLTTAVMSSTSNQIVTKTYPGNGVYTECLAIYAAGTNCLDTVCKPVVIFNCITNAVSSIALISAIYVYPNPVQSNITLCIDALKSEKAHVQINDALGRLVYETSLNLNSGKNEFKLPTSDLASSLYWIKVVDGHGNVKMLKFQKQ